MRGAASRICSRQLEAFLCDSHHFTNYPMKGELISDVLWWTPTHEHLSDNPPAKSYIKSEWTQDTVNIYICIYIHIYMRINFYLLRTFCPHLGSFCVVSSSLRFGQISPLAFFRWFTATSDRNAESCNRIPSNYCLL